MVRLDSRMFFRGSNGLGPEETPSYLKWALSLLLLFIFHRTFLSDRPNSALPVVTPERKTLLQKLLPSKLFWMFHGFDLIATGNAQHDGPFQIYTHGGWRTIFPNRYADELRNLADLSLTATTSQDFFPNYPGFDAFPETTQDAIWISEVVRLKLTPSLGLITDDLVEEAEASFLKTLGNETEFHPIEFKKDILDIVAQLSSRVFLGRPLYRNLEWLEVTKNHTIDLFVGAQILRLCPGLIRPLVHWFIPSCTRMRAQVRTARKLIKDEVGVRIDSIRAKLAAGERGRKKGDTIAWLVECSHGQERDMVAAQLSLSIVAIHTTTEITTNCIARLCSDPTLVTQLREETINVLSTEGWSRIGLYKLRLMDSVMREVQRMGGGIVTMNRIATKAITLSDGVRIPRGTRIGVQDPKKVNAAVCTNPEVFNPHRFLDMRNKPGGENRHQFAGTTSDHMGFGYGQHVCPGRFFAANEIKIFLCFFLLRYDFRLVRSKDGREETELKYIEFEVSRMLAPGNKIEIRRRHQELDLLNPSVRPKFDALDQSRDISLGVDGETGISCI